MIVASDSSRTRFALAIVAGAIALSLSSSARAQRPGENATVAEALFRDGVALFEANRVSEACAKFAESFRLDPANGTLQNEALCHVREGKVATAWAEFALLAGRAAQSGQRAREQMARAQVAELEAKLSRVTLVFARPDEIAEARVDGGPIGRAAWTTPLPLDPGSHVFTFRAPGKKTASRAIAVSSTPTALRMIVAPLEDDPHPAASPLAVSTEGPRRLGGARAIALVAAGTGVVLAGVGTYFGLRAIAKRNDEASHCVDRYCDAEGLALDGQAHSAATWSTITFGVGAAALAAGALLWLTAPRDDAHDANGADGHDARARLRVLPAIGARGGGASIEGRW